MGAEVFFVMGTWACLGWVLDAQRAVACAARAFACSWLF